jgi:hypothetical protein
MKKLYVFLLAALCLQMQSQVKYYINSSVGQPWGQTTNSVSMDAAFGAGNWTQDYFETVNTAALFTPSVCFIFMDGSDSNAGALSTFLGNNMTALQNWVAAGGKLLLNAAPNPPSTNINFGFGGVTLNYPIYSPSGTAAAGMTAYPIFNGPVTPAGTSYSGNSYAHGTTTGGTLVTVMDGSGGPVLTERFWGLGRVMFGGMTTTNFHMPSPNGGNLRSNILALLGGCCGAPPSISVTASSFNICAGQSVTIQGMGLNSGTYVCWPGNVTGTNIVVTPTAPTVYNVIGTPTSGCSGGITIKIDVRPAPSLSVTGNMAICPNGTANLAVSGAVTYSWSNGANTPSVVLTPTAVTVYTVAGTNSLGCTSTITTTVSINPNPTVSIVGSNSLCTGNSLTLTANGANSYSWSNGSVNQSIVVSPTANITYSVNGNSLGCTGTASTSISVYVTPTVSIAGGSSVICAGSTITLTASGANSYSWSNGGNTAVITVSPLGNTAYSVVGTTTAGCTNLASQVVTVASNPAVSAFAGPSAICAGQESTLMAFGATSYSWSTGATTSSNVVAPNVTTTFSVIGTVTPGCSSTATVQVTVNPSPTVAASGGGTMCAGMPSTLNATGATSYSWSNGATTSSIVVTPTATAVYTVTGTSAGCSNSSTVGVTVVICTGLASGSSSNPEIRIFPNPNTGEFFIQSTSFISRIDIYDVMGHLLLTKEINSNNRSVNISEFVKGIYFVKATGENGSMLVKMMKE